MNAIAPLIEHIEGWWWPSSDRAARPVILRDCERDVGTMLEHIRGRDCIVQAGGNVGVYPLALADHFQRVITFEPDPLNAACLKQNLRARDALARVQAHQAGLSDQPGHCAMVEVEARNCGAHRILASRSGTIPLQTIDGLNLPRCDAIWLDIEGAELAALRGAEQTIEKFSPTIAFEDKGHHRAFGVADGAIQRWLAALGYEEVARFGNDKVFTSTITRKV